MFTPVYYAQSHPALPSEKGARGPQGQGSETPKVLLLVDLSVVPDSEDTATLSSITWWPGFYLAWLLLLLRFQA